MWGADRILVSHGMAGAPFQQVRIPRKQVTQDGTQVAKEPKRKKQQKSKQGIWILPLEPPDTSTTIASESDWEPPTALYQSMGSLQPLSAGKKAAVKAMHLKEMLTKARKGDYDYISDTREYWGPYVVFLGPGAWKVLNYIPFGAKWVSVQTLTASSL